MLTKVFRYLIIAGILVLAIVFSMTPNDSEAADPTWFAQYWNNTSLSGSPVLTRQEAEIDHSWGTQNAGLTGVNEDNFSARWTRSVNFSTTGTYRFYATMDDGMRVWVDDVLIIDAWAPGAERTITADRYLTAGDHNLKVEYFDNNLYATARFEWQMVTTAPPTINNWRGEYYNNKNLSGAPIAVRDDANIAFNWGDGSPLPGTVTNDNFSVRWTRNLSLSAGRYQFTVTTDDGVRLWVNNELIIDRWQDQALTALSAEINVSTASIPVRMEYYEATGTAQAHLSWTPVGVTITNWRGEYYANNSLSGGPTLIRDDANIDFNWGEGGPATSVGNDNFSVRWTRTLNLPAGRYRFTTRTDDGVRLWVNNQLVIDRWYPQAVTSSDAEIEVSGAVSIRMEYFENTGFAEAHLSWALTTGGSGEPGTGGVGTATVRSVHLNVRQGPAISYAIITTLDKGDVVLLGGYRNATTTWVLLILPDGTQGWSYAPYLDTDYDLTTLPIWNSSGGGGTGGPAPSGATASVYRASHLNVRSGPGVSFPPIMTIPYGTVVQLIGRDSGSNWLKIQMPSGTQGWSSAYYLQTTYPISDLPVLTS